MYVFRGLGQPLEVTWLTLLNTQKTTFDIKKTKGIVAVVGNVALVLRSAFMRMASSLH